jgi:hypothetical protein
VNACTHFREAQRKLVVTVEPALVDQQMARTVHGLDRHGTVLLHVVPHLVGPFASQLELGEEHVLEIVCVVTGAVPHPFTQDEWGLHLEVTPAPQ